jgi:vacuolar-type H+-ATPase subunit C/Vma6
VSVFFGDLAARARGLATRLYSREELLVLARSEDLAAFAQALRARPRFAGAFEHPSAEELDRAVRRGARAISNALEDWAGPRRSALLALFEDEDRRSLRAIIRGAIQGLPKEARLKGLIPTFALPERALEDLAAQSSVAQIAARLIAWNNPLAEAVLPESKKNKPDMFEIELALDRTFTRRAREGARSGDEHLQRYVRRLIDLSNRCSAMLLYGREDASLFTEVFLEGGEHFMKEDFDSIAKSGGEAVRFQDRALADSIAATKRTALIEPTGSAPVVLLSLLLRACTTDLARLIWGLSIGVPHDVLEEELVTPP